jgi:hypothetical protein
MPPCWCQALPIFRATGMSDVAPFMQRPIFYSTYGIDGVVDPYAAKLGYPDLPFQARRAS